MIDRCFSCRRVPILMSANIAHTTWQCICDCGAASQEWNRNNEVKKVA